MYLDSGAYEPSATVLVSGVTAPPASWTPWVSLLAIAATANVLAFSS